MAEPTQVPPTNQTPVPAPKPSATPTPPVSGPLAALEAKFYEWFVYKAPFQFPAGLTDFIVKAAPWITLVIAILLVPFLFTAISGALFVSSLVAAYGVVTTQPTFMLWISLLVLVAQIIIMFVAVPKLLKRQRSGWLLVFYADLVSLAFGIVNSFAYGYFALGSIIWALISAAIGLYVLFQVRRFYVK